MILALLNINLKKNEGGMTYFMDNYTFTENNDHFKFTSYSCLVIFIIY